MSSADQTGKQQRIQQARDSYSKNAASAQVIDAEYVDLYNPDTMDLQQERQDLHLTLEPDMAFPGQAPETGQKFNSSVSKYQMTPIDAPPPGTYLNIFA
ncbi:MAG: hypothetical protein QNK24_05800 [Desulfuromusa sp.]|nr:hypothetical protein [Desulfuromusa sp.]